MAFDNTATTLGLGFTGKPTAKLEVGGNLSLHGRPQRVRADPRRRRPMLGSAALLAATGGLPEHRLPADAR